MTETWTLDDYRERTRSTRSKYRNRRVTVGGYTFDSQAEAEHYGRNGMETPMSENLTEASSGLLSSYIDRVVAYEVKKHTAELQAAYDKLRTGVQRFGSQLSEDRTESGEVVGINAPEAYLEPGDDGFDLALFVLQVEYDDADLRAASG